MVNYKIDFLCTLVEPHRKVLTQALEIIHTCIHPHGTVHVHKVIIRCETCFQKCRTARASNNFFDKITELC